MGEAAFGEEGVFGDVVKPYAASASVKELGVLHGHGAVEIAFAVVHDDEALMLGITLGKQALDAFEQNLVSLKMNKVGRDVGSEMALVDDDGKQVHPVLSELRVIHLRQAGELVVVQGVEERAAFLTLPGISQVGGFDLAIHYRGIEPVGATKGFAQA